MDLQKLASTLLSTDAVSGLSKRSGASSSEVKKVLTQALPILLGGADEQADDIGLIRVQCQSAPQVLGLCVFAGRVDQVVFKLDVLRFIVGDFFAAQHLRECGFTAFAAAHQN